MQDFVRIGTNCVLFLLEDSLDATLQKYIVNACLPLNTAKIKKIIKMELLLMIHPLEYFCLKMHNAVRIRVALSAVFFGMIRPSKSWRA